MSCALEYVTGFKESEKIGIDSNPKNEMKRNIGLESAP